jgi:hypothetical protein
LSSDRRIAPVRACGRFGQCCGMLDRLEAGPWKVEAPGGRISGELWFVLPLIERLATENHGWGYKRIQGELLTLGHRVSASTIRRVFKALRIPPAPQRHTDTTLWGSIIRSRLARLAG